MGINLTNLGKTSYPRLRTPESFHEDPVRVAAELVSSGSIEFSFGNRDKITERADRLPYGMPVFVPLLPRHSLDSRLDVIRLFSQAGLDPVPHLAARHVRSRSALVEFLAFAAGEAGVHRVFLVGGDNKEAAGPYRDAAAVLSDGLLQQAGITEVGFAGYPEGHPEVSAHLMLDALKRKLELAGEAGMGAHVVTQFTMVPTRIIEFCSGLAAVAPDVPVFAGMAGPASASRLVHFARYCGVSASLSAVRKVGVKLPQVINHAETDEQLALLAGFNATHHPSNIIGVHLFSFGGFRETVEWVNQHCKAAA